MKPKLMPVVLLMAAWVAGCSSLSLPSMPWSGSAVKPDPGAEALFEEGMRYFNEKKYVRAIDNLTKVKTDYPFSPLLIDAELKIADAYYLNQQYAEAIAAFKEFQSLHASNENIPFVVYRLGQAHFDQVTTTDRDQKNTEIARGYFETVVTKYPQSPFAAPAKESLAKCIGYLAEYDFNVASFYFKQEKYPAARDRFEEIVRKYRGTPVAAKSLFFLGESYRKEKNNVRAGLAYEALIAHYPESKLAPEAKNQLAQIEKDKQDPLAMLLMRDRRPSTALAGEANSETASAAKLKEGVDNLVAKTEVVYEEPGEEKTVFSRVVDAINPFSSSDSQKKKDEQKPESGIDIIAKKKAAEKQESPGVVATLWSGVNPFASGNSAEPKKDGNTNQAPLANQSQSAQQGQLANQSQLVNQIDDSLKAKGIDSQTQMASLKAPAAELPKEEPPPQTMDTEKLLGDIDANLKKGGRNATESPEPPESAEVFRNPAAAQAIIASASAKAPEPASVTDSGLLSSIDQKLKSQGVEPSKFELPPMASETKQNTPPQKQVSLDAKIAVEKGPLFLTSSQVQTQGKPDVSQEPVKEEKKLESSADKPQEPAVREIPRVLVKGPSQPQPVSTAAKPPEQKKTALPEDEEIKGVVDYLKDDLESIGKVLNPFRW